MPSKEYVKVSPNPKATELDEEGLDFALASGKQLTRTQDGASVHPVGDYFAGVRGQFVLCSATFVS